MDTVPRQAGHDFDWGEPALSSPILSLPTTPLDRTLSPALRPSDALTMADTADTTASTQTTGMKKPIIKNITVRTFSSGRILFTIN